MGEQKPPLQEVHKKQHRTWWRRDNWRSRSHHSRRCTRNNTRSRRCTGNNARTWWRRDYWNVRRNDTRGWCRIFPTSNVHSKTRVQKILWKEISWIISLIGYYYWLYLER